MPTIPFIFIKNYDLATISEELDSYGYMEQDAAEVHEIDYEIHKTAGKDLIIEFPNGIPFPEFMFVTMDMYNQILYKKGCEIYGFYPTDLSSPITQVFGNQWIALYTDETINEEDELETLKIVTASNELFEIELADLFSTRLDESATYPKAYFENKKIDMLEAGKIYIDKEDYEAEYLEDMKGR